MEILTALFLSIYICNCPISFILFISIQLRWLRNERKKTLENLRDWRLQQMIVCRKKKINRNTLHKRKNRIIEIKRKNIFKIDDAFVIDCIAIMYYSIPWPPANITTQWWGRVQTFIPITRETSECGGSHPQIHSIRWISRN